MGFWLELKKFFGSSHHLDGRSGAKYIEILRSKYINLTTESKNQGLPDDANNGKPKSGRSAPAKQGKQEELTQNECRAQLKKILDHYDGDNVKWEDGSFNRKDTTIWSDAYECDRLLVALYKDDQVKLELEKRIVHAQNKKLDFASFFEARAHVQISDQAGLAAEQNNLNRILLGQIIERQQWYDNQLYIKRQYASAAQKRVAFTFLFSLAIFGIMLIDHFDSQKILDQTGSNVSEIEGNAVEGAE